MIDLIGWYLLVAGPVAIGVWGLANLRLKPRLPPTPRYLPMTPPSKPMTLTKPAAPAKKHNPCVVCGKPAQPTSRDHICWDCTYDVLGKAERCLQTDTDVYRLGHLQTRLCSSDPRHWFIAEDAVRWMAKRIAMEREDVYESIVTECRSRPAPPSFPPMVCIRE